MPATDNAATINARAPEPTNRYVLGRALPNRTQYTFTVYGNEVAITLVEILPPCAASVFAYRIRISDYMLEVTEARGLWKTLTEKGYKRES